MHALESVTRQPTFYGPDYWVAECSCHNPDGDGAGRADFSADTPVNAVAGWAEHAEVSA